MKKKEIIIIASIALSFIIFFLIAIFNNDLGYMPGGSYEYPISFILMFIVTIWGFSLVYRSQFKKQRIFLILLISVLFIFMLLRYIKWLPNIYELSIYLDYIYHIPMILVSLLFLIMTLETFYSSFKKRFYIYIILGIIFTVIVAIVLSNDLHHLVYKDAIKHVSETNEKVFSISMDYGPLYYVVLGFVGANAFATLILFFFGIRKQLSIIQTLTLSSGFILLIAYVVLYILGITRHLPFIRDFATSISLILMLLMEILIDIGLIQNNGRYAKNFKKSIMDIKIKDEEDKYIYETSSNVESSKYKEEILEIGKYKAYIKEDLSNIKNLETKLAEENKNIALKNKQLETLIKARKEESPLSYRLTLIKEIEENIKNTKIDVLKRSKNLPDKYNEDVKKELSYIELSLGYMKQKCMLLLNAKEESNISNENLKLLMNVVSKDINNAGYEDVGINILSNKELDISLVSSINDFIYSIAKGYMFGNISLLIVINTEEKTCSINLFTDKKEYKEIDFDNKGKYIYTKKDNEDGLVYLMEAKYE